MKIDLTPILVSLIMAVAAVSVASILKPPRFVPIGMGKVGQDYGYHLNRDSGAVSFGPL